MPPGAAYGECICMDGVLYAMTATGGRGIDAFDLPGPTILRKVIMEDTKNYIYEHVYISQTPLGDFSVGDEDDPESDPSEFIEETGEDNPECGPLEHTMETRKLNLVI